MKLINVEGFGSRLKAERERLGLSLQDFGELGDVNRMTQGRYETEVNFPTLDYLHKIEQHEVNVAFLVSGVSAHELNPLADIEGFLQASDLIDAIAREHKFVPSVEVRSRAVAQIYRKILKFGVKKVQPTLSELLTSLVEKT